MKVACKATPCKGISPGILDFHIQIVSLHRPPGNNLVYLRHQSDRFFEGDHDFLVVGNVIIGERAAFAVFEPFFTDLVAADMEIPDLGRDAFKILLFIDIDSQGGTGVPACAANFCPLSILYSTFSTKFDPETGYLVMGVFNTGDSMRCRATNSAPFSVRALNKALLEVNGSLGKSILRNSA